MLQHYIPSKPLHESYVCVYIYIYGQTRNVRKQFDQRVVTEDCETILNPRTVVCYAYKYCDVLERTYFYFLKKFGPESVGLLRVNTV